MYAHDPTVNTLVRRVEDEYPLYVKQTSGEINFKRQIEQEKSRVQTINGTNYGEKSSLVHMASIMKAKSNGK